MVGERIAKEFEKLQDDNPPISYEEVKGIIERELGGNIDNLFAEFSKESLATASIGQVHEARLISGERVAVKVQKEGIADKLEYDIAIMKHLASQVHKHNDEFRKYNLPGMIDEFDYTIHIEIDFINELVNMKQLEANFSEDESIHIPAHFLHCKQYLCSSTCRRSNRCRRVQPLQTSFPYDLYASSEKHGRHGPWTPPCPCTPPLP